MDQFLVTRVALRIGCVVLLLVGAVATAQELSPQEQFDAALAAGDQHVEQGNLDDALQAYSQAIQIGAYRPEPYAKRAEVFVQMEEYEAALKDFKDALDRSPNLTDALAGRAELYLKLGAPAAALEDAQLAYEADRNNPRHIYNLGKVYALGGAAQQALRLLDRYIAIAEREEPETYRLRAQAQVGMGDFAKARQDIEHAIALDPEAHESHFALGMLHVQADEYDQAAQAFEQSIAHFTPPKGQEKIPYVAAHQYKALAHEEAGKKATTPEAKRAAYEAQIAECERLLDALPEIPGVAGIQAATYFRRGVGERLLGRLGDAVRSFSEALEISPGLAEAYFRRGICFREMDEERLAIRDFQQAAAIDFESPRAFFWEGLSWAKLGDYHQAIRAYGDAIGQSERYVPAYVNRGLAYVQLGEHEKAVRDFNEAIRLQPTVASHYYKRGVAYSLQGEREKAIGSLMNAISFDEQMAPAYSYLADELARAGRRDLANEYRRKAQELQRAAGG